MSLSISTSTIHSTKWCTSPSRHVVETQVAFVKAHFI
jgi:hypothetical protein